MPINANIKANVNKALQAVAASTGARVGVDPIVYELGILVALVNRLKFVGYAAEIRDAMGNPNTNLRVRLHQGYIRKIPSAAGHILVTPSIDAKPEGLEFHNRVLVDGMSGVYHEADIALVEPSTSKNVKQLARAPWLLIEAKYADFVSKRYKSINEKALGREMLTLGMDTQALQLVLITVQPGNTAITKMFNAYSNTLSALHGARRMLRKQFGRIENDTKLDKVAARIVKQLTK